MRTARRFGLLSALAICLSVMVTASPSTHAGEPTIFRDDFDGDVLGDDWEVKLGNAWVDDGWAVLQHLPNGIGLRDSGIITHEASDWTDYRVTTRFDARGGGNNWYFGTLLFRVADYHGSPARGAFYGVAVRTPLFGSNEGPGVILYKSGVTTLKERVPPDGVFNDHVNDIEVEVEGGHIKVWVNGWLAIDFVDRDPIPAGGVGLHVDWEAQTRFDFIDVTPLTRTCGGITVPPGEGSTVSGYNVMIGTNGADFLKGTPGNDLIIGLGGKDVILAGMGDDVVCAGEDADVVVGGHGADSLHGEHGNDRIIGGTDDDQITGGPGKDLIEGGNGDDHISGDGGNDTIRGSHGNDVLRGGPGSDELRGDVGNDQLFGDAGDDVLRGHGGIDVCDGGGHVNGDQAFSCETVTGIP